MTRLFSRCPLTSHRRQGHWEHCASDLERAVQLDPRNVWLLQDAAETYQFLAAVPGSGGGLGSHSSGCIRRSQYACRRALVDMDSRADTQPMHEAIENIIIKIQARWTRLPGLGSFLLFAGVMPPRSGGLWLHYPQTESFVAT